MTLSTVSLGISIYLLLAWYLYYRDRRINKKVMKYVESAFPVPSGAIAGVAFGYALLMPVLALNRLVKRIFRVKEAPPENVEDLNKILEEICPEEVHDLDNVSIELEKQDIEPFIRQIPLIFESGLTEIWIRRILDDIKTLEVDDENSHIFYPMWKGKRVTLVTEISREKKELFVLLFWALPDVINVIDAKMDEFCEKN